MTLLEELKERRDRQEEVLDEVAEAIKEREEYRLRVEQVLDDLDLAIAALQPGEIEITVTNDEPDLPTPIVNTDEGWELEPSPAELFEAEKSEAREQLEREDDASEFAEPMPDPEFVVLDEQTCEPVDEAPALNEQMQDERELTAALPQPEWNEPRQSISMIDEQTCEPVDPTLRAFEDDHIVEPQPTEGYAPVTNPEADFWARGLAQAEPEKKHRFSIFGHKRETEDA